jgi:hypothetical protein
MRKTRPLYQRYRREFWPPMAAYIAVMLLLWPLLPRVHNEWLKIALAQLPVVPLLFAVRAMVRLAMGGDELEQRIHLIALAIAATVLSMLSLVGGFLAAAHLINLDGTILMWMWPTLVVVYSAARVWASHRYGGAGDGVGTCDRHGPVRWVLLISLVFAVVTLIIGFRHHHQLSGYELGLLYGMWGISAGLGSWGLLLAIAHRRKRQLGADETS